MTPAVAERLAERAVTSIAVPTAQGSGVLLEGSMLLCGWSVRETTGAAAAVFELYSGDDQRGELVASVNVPAGDSRTLGPATAGVSVEAGLYFRLVSGALTGAVWVRAMGE